MLQINFFLEADKRPDQYYSKAKVRDRRIQYSIYILRTWHSHENLKALPGL